MVSSGNQIVFVLGMHRSGTSLTAELVSGLGYSVPGELLDPMGEVNARGFWESRNVVAFNERLLEAAQLKWFHVCPVGHFFKAVSPDTLREISLEIKAFIDAELIKSGRLVIKDPRLCILLPVWLSVIDRGNCDVKIVFVNRHPASVAGSLQARDGFSLFSGHLLWLYYFFSVFGRDSGEEIFFLNYEDILNDPHSCGAMLRFLGVAEVNGEVWLKSVDSTLQRNFRLDFPDKGDVYNLAKDSHAVFSHGRVIDGCYDAMSHMERYERFVFENNDFVYALNESSNNISGLRNELISIGDLHTHALHVIHEKDVTLGQLRCVIDDLQYAVAGRDAYIAECEGRIFDLQFSVAEFSALRERIASLEKLVRQRNTEALRNEAYIARLDTRIAELHEAMAEFEALRQRISQIEFVLQQKNSELEDKTRAIFGAEERIVELDGLFVGQRSNYLSSLGVIDGLEKKLASRNDEFFSVVDELTEVKDRLDSLLAWRVVRLIDRRVSKGVNQDD